MAHVIRTLTTMLFAIGTVLVAVYAFAKAFRDEAWTTQLRDQGLPLVVNLQLALDGPHDDIVRTLEDLSDRLQHEVDERAGLIEKLHARTGHKSSANDVRTTIQQKCRLLAVAFARAEKDFGAAFSPGGSPRNVQKAYARLLSAIVRAEFSMAMVQAPLEEAHTELAFHYLLGSIYAQLAAWPETIREAVPATRGDSHALGLSVSVETAALVRALLQAA